MAVVYTAATLSLAAVELFVNLDPDALPPNLVSIGATIPDEVEIEAVSARDLPRLWRQYPAPARLQAVGDDWVARAETAVLSVPSAVITEERNYLLNPAHPRFRRIRTAQPRPFRFDPRMWK